MACYGTRLPENRTYESTLRFLVHNQFPAIMEQQTKYYRTLPMVGIYRRFNNAIRDFGDAIHSLTKRQYTISGCGSLLDYEKYGRNIRRPTPQLAGTGCNGGSLCSEMTCFSMREGVIESNNLLQSICWSLQMDCLKDSFYSDRDFEKNMSRYFDMFFKQGPVVVDAFQRANLLKESIKVVCTEDNITWTGTNVGLDGFSLPYYINFNDPLAFPDLDDIGSNVGGANLDAFATYVAPRIFSGAFGGVMEDIDVYGLSQDFRMAIKQTSDAIIGAGSPELAMLKMVLDSKSDPMTSKVYGNFVHDPLFPTFGVDSDNVLLPITKEVLEPSTIAGVVQTDNPNHSTAKYRAFMLIPKNWRYDIVAPEEDDFSFLGLGNALNFRTNTPGVTPIMSTSMFRRNTLGADKTLYIGSDMSNVSGLMPRDRVIDEAVRTELMLTYQNASCMDAYPGQLPNVAPHIYQQKRASGFTLLSTINIGTYVEGIARPVLFIFRADEPRGVMPVKVCTSIEKEITTSEGYSLVNCCPGGQVYAILTFSKDVSSVFTVGNSAVYRTGDKGTTTNVTITAVSGAVVTITAANGTDIISCCSGSPDDYGVRGELIVTTGATATSAEVMKALCTDDVLALELFTPIAAAQEGAGATITLDNGQVINVVLASALASPGVFVSVEVAEGETCDLCSLDCACLQKAVFALNVIN